MALPSSGYSVAVVLSRVVIVFSLLSATQSYAFDLNQSRLTTPAGQWLPPLSISTSGLANFNARIKVDQQGNAIAIWEQKAGDNRDLYASRYPFQTAELLENLSGITSHSQLRVNADGSAFVTWLNKANGAGRTYGLYASRYTITDGWNEPVQIADNLSGVYTVANSSNGNGILAWSVIENGVYQVYASLHSVSAGWGSPVAVPGLTNSHTRRFRNVLDADINTQGDAVVTWQKSRPIRGTGSKPPYAYDAYASRYIDEIWQPAELLETADELIIVSRSRGVAVGIDDSSNVITVWSQQDSNDIYQLYSNRHEPGGGWLGAIPLHDSSTDSLAPKFAINSDGVAIVSWRESNQTLWSKQFLPDEGWQDPVMLDDADGFGATRLGNTSVNGNGQAAVIWQGRPVGHATPYDIYTNRFDGNSWQVTETLKNSADNALTPDISIADDNQIIAVWAQTDIAAGLTNVRSRRFAIDDPYYEVRVDDSWASIALFLYDSATVADELQLALNRPELNPGVQLTELPTELDDTNAAPIAANDENITGRNDAIQLDVLNNDSDPDNNVITILSTTAPANGAVSIAVGGLRLTYTPNNGFTGIDTFTYTIADGNAATSTATVTLVVFGATTDADGDGVIDINDRFPLDPAESADFDNDAIGDNADLDDDNDGIPDANDVFPFDATEWADTDGDGTGDNADPVEDNAIIWLLGRQNLDGSWGVEQHKFLVTSEVISALRTANLLNSAYYAGIAWLESHASTNNDYRARRIAALQPHGDDVSAEFERLKNAKSSADNIAWGLSKTYQGTILDTAITLQALARQTFDSDQQAALDYIKARQLPAPGYGWPLTLDGNFDSITTAQTLRALLAHRANDSSLMTFIDNAISALNNGISADSLLLAKAHTALALLSADATSVNGLALLTQLRSQQLGNGSFDDNLYATAIIINATAISQFAGLSIVNDPVQIPDPLLRAGVNQLLGKNQGDAITQKELLLLQAMNLSNRGITDLSGLENALNLISIDVSNNQITTLAPLFGLPNLLPENIKSMGNPL